MHLEKSKLKHLQVAVRQKREDLAHALAFTKVQDMENRIRELQLAEPELDKKLEMLERIKNN